MDSPLDLLGTCIEEIALEGLDGISIKTLWHRLEIREPPLELDVNDEMVRSYLWRGFVDHPGLSYFELREPRILPIVRRQFEILDESSGLYVCDEEREKRENYPVFLIKDGPVRGSCSTYYARDDVTTSVWRSSGNPMSAHEAFEKFGEKLVIVASQEERERVLFGSLEKTRIDIELHDAEYLLVERIGRARRAGEIPMIHDAKAPNCGVRTDPKTQFYHRKKVTKSGYITQQFFFYQSIKDRKSKRTCIMFLPRFHRPVENKSARKLYEMADYLSNCPNQIELYPRLREKMLVSLKGFKQLMSHHKHFGVEFHPVSMFYELDNEADSKYLDHFKDGSVRTIRCVKLLKHPRDVAPDEEDADEIQEDTELPFITEIAYNRTINHEAYARLVAAGPLGLSISEFQKLFGVKNKIARSMVRNLCRSGYVTHYVHDFHKQRTLKIVAKCYRDACPMKHWNDLEMNSIERIIKGEVDVKEELDDPGDTEPPAKKQKKDDTKKGKKEPAKKKAETPKKKSGKKTSAPEAVDVLNEALMPQEEEVEEEEEEEESNVTDTPVEDQQLKLITHETDVKDIFSYERSHRLVSAKYLSRARQVLEAVKQQQVVEHLHILRKTISEKERNDGHTATFDPKVLKRLVGKLEENGQLKSVKSVITVGEKEKNLHIICDMSVDTVSDPRIQAIFDKTKLELSKRTSDPKPKYSNSKIIPSLKYDIKLGKKYGVLPKMRQLEAFHKYLFYLLYEYEGLADEEAAAKMYEPGALDTCAIYKDEYSFKRFIPPMPKRIGFQKPGWFITADIIWHMPILIFCQIINIPYDIPELIEILNDPVNKYVPMFRIEASLLEKLMSKRNHIFRILKLLTSMCHMGLITFGPSNFKEKDQVPAFLHRLAGLLDTTKSRPGYCQITEGLDYPKSSYRFNSVPDIDDYWNDLQFISMNTQLGTLRKDSDQPEKYDYRSLLAVSVSNLKPWTNPRKPGEEIDNGIIPGDGKGAAGLDTSFFNHRKSNWTHGSLNQFSQQTCYKDDTPNNVKPILKEIKKTRTKKRPKQSAALGASTEVNTEISPIDEPLLARKSEADDISISNVPVAYGFGSVSKPPQLVLKEKLVAVKTRLTMEKAARAGSKRRRLNSINPDSSTSDQSSRKQRPKQRVAPKKVKKLPPRPKVIDTPDNYEKDQEAKRVMTALRVKWTNAEDNMLLWFKIAHIFLGYREVQIVAWPDLRDILHKHLEQSKDKTSKACARRLLFMCRNKNTTRTISLLAAKALQNKALMAKYKSHRIKEKKIILPALFEKLVMELKDLIKEATTECILPDSLEELDRLYKVECCNHLPKADSTQHKDPTSTREICEATIHSLIHSTVSLGKGQNSRRVDLFKLFRQYPDELMLTVCRRMVSDRMITKLKVLRPDEKCNMTSLKSYQLSQRYWYMLFRVGPGFHPQCIFDNTVDPFQSLISGFHQGQRNQLDCTDVDSAGQTCVLATYTAMRKLIFNVNIPEHLIVVEFSNSAPISQMNAKEKLDDEDDELICELPSKHVEVVPEGVQPEPESTEERSTIQEVLIDEESVNNTTADETVREEIDGNRPRETEKRSANSTTQSMSPQPSTSRSLSTPQQSLVTNPASGLVSQPIPTLPIPVPGSLKHTSVNSVSKEKEELKNDLKKMQLTKASRFMLSMARHHHFRSIESGSHNRSTTRLASHDFLAVKPCNVLVRLKKSLKQPPSLVTADVMQDVIDDIEAVIPDDLDYKIFKRKYRSQLVDKGIQELDRLYNAIFAKKQFGLTWKELVMMSSDFEILEFLLAVMLKEHIVIKVGVTVYRYVSYPNIRPWLVHASKPKNGGKTESKTEGDTTSETETTQDLDATQVIDLTEESENTGRRLIPHSERRRIVCQPWRFPEGPINSPVLKRMVESIMVLISSKPGISEDSLVNELNPILQPCQVSSLVEILEKIGAVKTIVFTSLKKASLFSPRERVHVVEMDLGNQVRSFTPSIDGIIRLGQFFDELNARDENLNDELDVTIATEENLSLPGEEDVSMTTDLEDVTMVTEQDVTMETEEGVTMSEEENDGDEDDGKL